MKDNAIWYGFLEAGNKSSPVLLDYSLDTGKSDTLYLFNLTRNAILEYNRAIVEPKLRELGSDEAGLIENLQSGFSAIRGDFTPRSSGKPAFTAPATRNTRGKNAISESDDEDDEDLDDSDMDIWDDDDR